TLLWLLVAVAAVIFSQSIWAEYIGHEGNLADRPPLLRHPWLDSRAAATALVGLLGLAVARANLALVLRPYLSYSNISPKVGDDWPKFIVLLRNEGTGPAVIVRLRYRLRFEADDFESILDHE